MRFLGFCRKDCFDECGILYVIESIATKNSILRVKSNVNDDEHGAAIMPQYLVVPSDIAWSEVIMEESRLCKVSSVATLLGQRDCVRAVHW